MNLEAKPPELDAGSSVSISALCLLEMENSNLRRLVVELLEKNQQLREQLRVLGSGPNPGIVSDLATDHRVDPRAA